jgi:cysteine desulfurase
MMNPIYLDNNATTRVAPEVLEAMLPYLAHLYGNPSSQHLFGEPIKRRIGEARSAVAALLGASPAEIVFTSGATESNHTAIMGALAMRPERREIVTTSVEHPALLRLFQRLNETGYRVTYLPVGPDGAPDLDVLKDTVTEHTALVSMMWANNETGVVFPVAEALGTAKNRGAIFHTDAVQAVAKIPLKLSEITADLLSFSGHKLHAPKGIGVLFVRKGLTLPPLLFGHQERGRRGGTENVPGIVGLGKACEVAAGNSGDTERIRMLRDRLEAGLLRSVPTAVVNGCRDLRVPNTSNLRFGTMDAEAILSRLNRLGIAASAGSACSSGGTEPSHVLMEMGHTREEALASVRLSLSRYTTIEEISRVLDVLPGIMEELTAMDLVRG